MEETKQQTPKKKLGTGAIIAISCGGILLLGGIITAIVLIIGAMGVSKVAEEINKQQQNEEDAETQAFNNPSSLGETITVNNVQWTLTEATNLGSSIESLYGEYGSDCLANSGSFIKVTVKVKNNGNEMVSVTDLNLYDSQKREYIPSSDVYSCMEDELFILDNINPGIEKTFVTVYEIPSGATGLRLKAGDLDLFSEGHKYISLGF